MTLEDAFDAIRYAKEHPGPIEEHTLQSMYEVGHYLVFGSAGDGGRNGGVVIHRLIDEVRRLNAEVKRKESEQGRGASLETLQEYQAVVFGAVIDGVYAKHNYWWNRLSELWRRDCVK